MSNLVIKLVLYFPWFDVITFNLNALFHSMLTLSEQW